MSAITIKDIPPFLHKALKHHAKQPGRSLNREAVVCLEEAVHPVQTDVDSLLADIRTYRASLPGRLGDGLIREATL